MTCAHRGPFSDGDLVCTRDDHDDLGHVFESTSAGDAEAGGGDE
jgi:hypothetical protein